MLRSLAYRLPFLVTFLFASLSTLAQQSPTFTLKPGDHVTFIGSSSTEIGTYCKTVEFLVRTRHPEMGITFSRVGKGGWTFDRAQPHLDQWLAENKPSVVLFNFGANDAWAGDAGIAAFQQRMAACINQATAYGARVAIMTPQGADIRKAGAEGYFKRLQYGEKMLDYGAVQGWSIIDVVHPLNTLQLAAMKSNQDYSINTDGIHLTTPGYVAWGVYLYQGLNLPVAESAVELTASGKVRATRRCTVSAINAKRGEMAFTRADNLLPLLPPANALPPRQFVPLEAISRYMLKITGLSTGAYLISCEGKPLGTVNNRELAAGINLNSLLLDSGNTAPWDDLARELWDGKSLDQIGKTSWRFAVKKQ